MGTCAVLLAVRNLAVDGSWAQGLFGPIVRRLDPWIAQEAQRVAPLTVPTQFIEQPLIVGIFQTTIRWRMTIPV